MIVLENVSKVIPSGSAPLTILHPTSLDISDGEFVAVVGPSGSGKSTMLGLIAGLDSPTTGRILINGSDITAMREDALARFRGRAIGFIFQSFHLVPSLTAIENIAVPLEIAGKRGALARARELIDAVGLSDRTGHYPSQLSGGEQQRVAIARAFSNEPEILLADEPTGNLDSANGRQILELLTHLNRDRGATLVLVTHDHGLAARASRRISLADGHVVEDVSTGSVQAVSDERAVEGARP